MKRLLLLCPFLWLTLFVSGQYNCWIQFANKKGTSGSFTNPATYLSERAIARRAKQHIAIDSTDLPVSNVYINAVLARGVTLKSASKWLNGITINMPDTLQLSAFRAMPFVKKTELTLVPQSYTTPLRSKSPRQPAQSMDNYGDASRQIDIHNGRKLHAEGYRGKGMIIGVLDAGFYKTDQISVFDSLRLQNRLLGTRDFADTTVSFFANTESHGTNVLSTMAANAPGVMIGSAPDASFWLIRTEYAPSEYPVEADNWVAGIEFADSVGVDIVNSSLGYTEFDFPGMNYTFQTLNGRTSRASIAATMAAKKGIIVVCSAGNEGDKAWHSISAPADADSILTVGAIDYNRMHAPFSGNGPTADGRIKPDVCAVGVQSVIATPLNTIASGNGTSFASPIMAGLVACAWQALPSLSNMQIIRLMKEYSSQYTTPDNMLGYGIPDVYSLYKANYINSAALSTKENGNLVYFNNESLIISRLSSLDVPATASLYTPAGQKIAEWAVPSLPCTINTTNYLKGFYILSIQNNNSKKVFKLIKH